MQSETHRRTLATSADSPPTRRCYWVVPGKLLAGAYPGDRDPAVHASFAESLWRAGIRTFVNLVHAHEAPNGKGTAFTPYDDVVERLASAAHARHACVRLPVEDRSVPTREEMTFILDTVDRSLAGGDAVYVHCWGGRGRSATVVGCWLLRHELTTSEGVLETIKALRVADRERAAVTAPQTMEQRRFVLDWRG